MQVYRENPSHAEDVLSCRAINKVPPDCQLVKSTFSSLGSELNVLISGIDSLEAFGSHGFAF